MRREKDFLGESAVPAGAYFGLETQRAVENFPISGLRAHPAMIEAFVHIKKAAALRNLAVELNRIANDLRLLASGPRTGLAEIILPAVAPGSSIMPGKVNPSILEMLNMVCYQVIGGDAAIAGAAQAGQLELNAMMPVIAFNLNFMIQILGNAMKQVKALCLDGIRADTARCRMFAEKSVGLATVLSPLIGYAKTAEVVRAALATGKSIPEIVKEKRILGPEELEKVLDPLAMTDASSEETL